jgi:hypothetical protein
MQWCKRIAVALPFTVAVVLMLVNKFASQLHLHREHMAGYVFLFATPWAWLLDHPWFGSIQTRWIAALVDYAVLLWIPALLYSICLWTLVQGIALLRPKR